MSDEYAREITKQSVARACAALGIKNTYPSVIESLADVMRHYIQSISEKTLQNCETSGRLAPGIQDLIPILGDNSWKVLRDFAFEDVNNPNDERNKGKWNQPFPVQISKFPVKKRNISESMTTLGEVQIKGAFVPSHLPSYPPAHTYRLGTSSISSKKRKNNSDKNIKSTNEIKIPDISIDNQAKRQVSIKSIQLSLAKIEDSADQNSLMLKSTETQSKISFGSSN